MTNRLIRRRLQGTHALLELRGRLYPLPMLVTRVSAHAVMGGESNRHQGGHSASIFRPRTCHPHRAGVPCVGSYRCSTRLNACQIFRLAARMSDFDLLQAPGCSPVPARAPVHFPRDLSEKNTSLGTEADACIRRNETMTIRYNSSTVGCLPAPTYRGKV
jgi:hypothetical protein